MIGCYNIFLVLFHIFTLWPYFPALEMGISSVIIILFIFMKKFYLKKEIDSWLEKSPYNHSIMP
ncbi:hypothetical protein CEV08_04605 [Bartonella tribocorum]|uniref:Uncharacterized protein n=1 Tax=Bartonella tribocorum TaxID=85701 RepID=A0A2M6UVV5_9HYPH|nr:hypothetical protein CEV08_04605 [Bartonella tribocorum]